MAGQLSSPVIFVLLAKCVNRPEQEDSYKRLVVVNDSNSQGGVDISLWEH